MRGMAALIDQNIIKFCPITREYVIRADDIYGANLGSLKGKTVRRAAVPVDEVISPVPHDIMDRYRNVTLAVDLICINKVPFPITVSHHIKYCTLTHLKSRKTKTILTAFHAVYHTYVNRGLSLAHVEVTTSSSRFVTVYPPSVYMSVTI